MAQKPKVNYDMFQATAPEQVQQEAPDLDKAPGRIVSSGVGLTEKELAVIDGMADKFGISRNSLLRFAIRWFIRQVWAGNVDLSKFIEVPKSPKNKLNMP